MGDRRMSRRNILGKPLVVVWFSNGAASAVALKETVLRYDATHEVRAVNNPVIEEDEDNLRFARDVARWVGIEIERATNRNYPLASAVDVWDRRGAMNFPHGAPCTTHLKKEARQQYERQHRIEWHVFGFTADEEKRHARFVLTERSNVLPVLIDAGLTKTDCLARIEAAGIALPRVYGWGFPNANCIGCPKATSPTYWNLVRSVRPQVFAARAAQSRELGARLVRHKGRRLFLDELPPDAKGRPPKSFHVECGVICEEYRAPRRRIG